jgi:protocatechuate 3,4-dioxygenase beta subunit
MVRAYFHTRRILLQHLDARLTGMTHHHDDHDDHGGLLRDLHATRVEMNRRGWLRMAARLGGAVGTLQLIGCGGDSPTSPSATTDASVTTPGATTTTPPASGTSCSTRVPEETAGPFPGDGSNGPTVLSSSGVVRNDIRSSFAGLSGTADGVPLTVALTIVSASTCEPLSGRAVYIWHCDRLGRYSLYNAGVTNQNFLRGVQQADASGRVSFTSIFPGCYAGRWPHIHFEVYPSLAAATSVANKVATSQIALPKATCDVVYATSGYEASVRNLAGVSLSSDMVFSDGSALELATVAGDNSGYTAALTVAI